jgi:hypothetical protein
MAPKDIIKLVLLLKKAANWPLFLLANQAGVLVATGNANTDMWADRG